MTVRRNFEFEDPKQEIKKISILKIFWSKLLQSNIFVFMEKIKGIS